MDKHTLGSNTTEHKLTKLTERKTDTMCTYNLDLSKDINLRSIVRKPR